MDGQARFQLVVPDVACAPDVLGLWDTVRAARPFTVNSEATGSLCWQVDLPASLQAAIADVDRQTMLLRHERCMLAWQAIQRLESAVGTAGQAASFAFDIPQPERELAAWLQMMRGGQSFWPGTDLAQGWSEAVRQAQAFLAQVQRSLAYYALVETSVEGETLGWTAVHWLGNVSTQWRAGLGTEQVGLHQRTVGLAVESRATWMRVFLLGIQGAVMLSVTLGTPGGALLALPAALKFIRQILAEFRRGQQNFNQSP